MLEVWLGGEKIAIHNAPHMHACVPAHASVPAAYVRYLRGMMRVVAVSSSIRFLVRPSLPMTNENTFSA